MLALGTLLAVTALSAVAARNAMTTGGRTVSVTITNTTAHQTISPPVVVAHSRAYRPFALGEPLLPELVPLAEDGRTRDFVTVAKVEPTILDYAVARAPLAPGRSVTLQVRVDDGHPLLSAFGMLVTTNDAVFHYGADLSMAAGPSAGARPPSSDAMGSSAWVGSAGSMASADALGASGSMGSSAAMGSSGSAMSHGTASDTMTPETTGAAIDLYDGSVHVLDAGSEANTEACRDVPGPPCASVGARHPAMAEGAVSVHQGLTGVGDLDPRVYGWTDPVADVTLTTP